MTRRVGAGMLRDIISVQRATSVSDNMGGTEEGWETIISDLPASIAVQRGGEAVQSARLAGSAPVDITVRATDETMAIEPSDRALDGCGKVYAIKWAGTLDEGRPRWITLSCVAGTVAQR